MDKKENEKQEYIRYFLIEHKACGSNFTIKSDTFSAPKNNLVRCPNCDEPIFDNLSNIKLLTEFLRDYEYLIEHLETKNATIEEIEPEPTP